MKAVRLIIGIVSFLMALLVTFQSWFAGLSNAMEDNGVIGGTAGVFLSILLIVAGIIGVVTRKGEGKGPFVAGGFYIVGGLLAYAMAGSYSDLYIWSVVSVIFGIVFVVGTIVERKRK